MNQQRSHRRLASYPALGAFLVGVLVAGLMFRFSVSQQTGSSLAATDSGTTTGGSSNAASGSGPGLGTGTAMPTLGPSTSGTTSGGATGGVTGDGTILSGASGGATTGAVGGGGTGLTASDVGVTATAIKVGIALEDCSQCKATFGAAGGWGPDQDKGVWEAWINDINKTGGIYGRKIQPFYQVVDVTNASTGKAACTTWTETNHVFMVIGARDALGSQGDLCVTAQHHTLEITGWQPKDPDSYYQQSRNLLITAGASGNRAMIAWARGLEHYGQLKGHKVGLIVEQGSSEQVAKETLAPELKRLGYPLAYTAVVSNDPSQGPSQAAAQSSQFKSHGVDYIFDLVNFITMTSFVNEAQKDLYRPKYTVNDSIGGSVAFFYSGMPANSWDGTSLITYNGFQSPEQPDLTKCRLHYNKLTGHNVTPSSGRFDPADQKSGDNATEYSLAIEACHDMNMMRAAGERVGADLTRSRFAAAVQGLGSSLVMGNSNVNGGSFGPGKTDWADSIRMLLYGTSDGKSGNCTADGSKCFNDASQPYNPGS